VGDATAPFAWPWCEEPAVSAAMIVRDEAENLERCLESIRDVVDEVVILDTGSEDETISIAKDLGARVFEEPWQDDFALHRNHSLELARGRWVLTIDGDEVLDQAGDLRAALHGGADEVGADCVIVRIDALTDTGLGEQTLVPRAFLREKASYRYPVHNQLVGIGRPYFSSAVIAASYRGTMEGKAERTIRILERLVEEQPEDPHGPFFLCKTYRSIVDAEGTLRWGRRCRELVPTSIPHAVFWVWLFHATLAVEGMDAAEGVLEEALSHHKGLADLEHCRLALAAYRWQEAAREPRGYAFCPQSSPQFIANLPDASRLLGLPLEFRGAGLPTRT
jgi:glycosyltransferase involved in cell wall biosynthesis